MNYNKLEFKKNKLSKTILMALILGISTPTVYAQDNDNEDAENQQTDEETVELGKVSVTGSRIKRNQFEGSSPIQVMTSEQMTR